MIYQNGGYYHIYNRGCNKELIFRDERDYQKLWELIEKSDHKNYIELYAFVFMPNHFHFFVKQISDKPIYRWIQYIFNAYVQYYNNRHCRVGTLFEGNAKVRQIDDEHYLSIIAHYIHANPRNEKQKQHSSLDLLDRESIINKDYYLRYFGSIDSYWKSFEIYSQSKDESDIEKYLFG